MTSTAPDEPGAVSVRARPATSVRQHDAPPGNDKRSGAWASVTRVDRARVATLTPVVSLVVLIGAGAVSSSVFLTSNNIKAVLVQASILAVLAIGQTFVISTAGIDLSVASIVQLSAVVVGACVKHGVSIGLAIAIAVASGLVVGVVNGFIIVVGRLGDFIVTLGTFSAISGVALLISNAQPTTVVDSFMIKLSSGYVGLFSYLVIIAAVIAAVAWFAVFGSKFGTHVLAVGGNRKAAEAMGISRLRVKVAVYAISGVLAAVGGVMLVARLGSAEPTAGAEYQLTSIAAAVLGGVSLFGGRSSIWGAVTGAIILTGILNILNITSVPPYYQPIAVGLVVVFSALLRRAEEPR